MGNDHTLDAFFDFCNNDSSANYHSTAYLMDNIFGSENPVVGITEHGPQFVGVRDVKRLFDELINSFSRLVLLPQLSAIGNVPVLSSRRLYSQDHSTIGVQTILAGTHVRKWFPDPKDSHYSPPLSTIDPDGAHKMEIPACAVFTFDGDHKISRLQIYLDRYKLGQQLKPAAATARAH